MSETRVAGPGQPPDHRHPIDWQVEKIHHTPKVAGKRTANCNDALCQCVVLTLTRHNQKTGNAIRALGRMTKMSDSRRNSANSSNPATPRPSISGTLVPRMGSLEEEKLITKIQTSLITGSFDENDEVSSDHKDVLTQLPKETGRSKKEVRTRACSERSDSGISDCSTHTHVTSSSCNSTPLLGKKFPINEEGETYISSVSINLTSNHLRASSEESDSSPKLTRLSDKIQSFQSPNKSEFFYARLCCN